MTALPPSARENLAADQQALLDVLTAKAPLTGALTPKFILKLRANNDVEIAERVVSDESIGAKPDHDLVRGLTVYRSNAQQLAARSLQAAYPTVALLVGGENFTTLAWALWLSHPPQRGDMAQWGGQLAALLEQGANPSDGVAAFLTDLIADLPYLPDVARVEWALHQAATAADVPANLASLQHLVDHDLDRLGCVLAPGVCAVASPWPVAAVMQAHGSLLKAATPDSTSALSSADTETLEALFQAATAQTTLIWRRTYQPIYRLVDAAEWSFMNRLLQGASLGASLDAAPDHFDFNSWLPQAVHEGLLLGMQPL